MSRNLIDLFAGSGGLSLGLENAGFESIYVNELHPDALATYLSNRKKSKLLIEKNYSYDILDVTGRKKNLIDLVTKLKNSHGEIDLLVGGPPCQGFSGIGHRRTFSVTKEEIPTNHLYAEMSKFISAASPKVFIFENVRGLLTSKWNEHGEKGEIWNDVLSTFENTHSLDKKLNYNLYWELVFAKDFGVPQNRPRIILIGVRKDVNQFSVNEMKLLFESKRKKNPPDLIEVLGDLIDETWRPGGITERYPNSAKGKIQNEFRFNPANGRVFRKGEPVSDHEYSNHSAEVISKFKYMIKNKGKIPANMQTKKFAQRLLPPNWGERGPFITATSLPDDYVHFSQPRVLTVREWARLQTFPDWYEFVGKRTTGGRRRAGDPEIGDWQRDLPKYTQIGNAVPVKLATAIGEIVNEILE